MASGATPSPPEPPSDPLAQEELETLRAELRQALQLQRAAYEQMLEAQREVAELQARAQKLLGGGASGGPKPSERLPGFSRGPADPSVA